MIYYTENQIDDLRTVIAAKDAEIAELRTAMQRQANAVKMLDMSHIARAETMMRHAQVLRDQSNHTALESERSANALLTVDITRKDAEIARLRDMLCAIVNRCEGHAKEIARAALANGGGE